MPVAGGIVDHQGGIRRPVDDDTQWRPAGDVEEVVVGLLNVDEAGTARTDGGGIVASSGLDLDHVGIGREPGLQVRRAVKRRRVHVLRRRAAGRNQ